MNGKGTGPRAAASSARKAAGEVWQNGLQVVTAHPNCRGNCRLGTAVGTGVGEGSWEREKVGGSQAWSVEGDGELPFLGFFKRPILVCFFFQGLQNG